MLSFEKKWVRDGDFPELSLDKWQKTVDIMARVFKAPAGFIVQYREEGFQVAISSDQTSNPYPAGGFIPADTNVFCRRVVETSAPLYEQHASENPDWDDNPEARDDNFESYFGLPIEWPDGSPFGTICVMDYETTDYDETYQALLTQFRDMVQSDLAMVENMRKLKDMTVRDDLSGLLNRRGLYMEAERLHLIAQRYDHAFGVIFVDLDDLKLLNDKHGHAMGDLAIAAVGQAIGGVLRDSDVAGRIGGDEFVAMVFVRSDDDLALLCDRIHMALQRLTDGSMTLEKLSVSCGYVFFKHAPDLDFDDMIQAADKAMYETKTRRKAG